MNESAHQEDLTLDENELRSIKVNEIKSILRTLGLSPTGNKDNLISRAIEGYQKCNIQYLNGDICEEKMRGIKACINSILGSSRKPIQNSYQLYPNVSSIPLTTPQNSFEHCFNYSPFHKFIKTLYSTRFQCTRENTTALTFCVELKKEQLRDIHTIHLLTFPLNSSNPVHTWPTNFSLQINKSSLPLPRRLTKSKKSPDFPFDITSFLISGPNTFKLWSTSTTNYFVFVNLVEKISVSAIIEKVKQSVLNEEVSKFNIISSFSSENEVCEISSKLPLLDPLGRGRIQIPTRANTCNHILCFDLEIYLKFNERTPKWLCPICNKPALVQDLIVDAYFQRILRETGEDVDEVEITPQGEWKQITLSPEPIVGQKRKFEQMDRSDRYIESKSLNALYTHECYVCKKTEDTKRCSKCKSISYCDRKCQEKDWPRHKLECTENGIISIRDVTPSSPPKKLTSLPQTEVIVLSDSD